MSNSNDYVEIALQWELDGKCTRENIVEKSMEVPMLHGKYWNFLVVQKRKKAKLENEINKMTSLLHDFYAKRLNEDTIKANQFDKIESYSPMHIKLTPKEAEMRIAGNTKIAVLLSGMKETQLCIEFLESVLDTLKRISYTAKTYVDWEKFKSGQ